MIYSRSALLYQAATLFCESHSVMSDSLQPRGLYSPWNSPGQNTGVGGLSLLQGIFLTQTESRSPSLRADSLPAEPEGKPKNNRVGSLSLLQQIFPTQESNQDLLHCRWILYQLRPLGKPKNTVVDSLSLLQQIFPTQESNQGLLNCRRILYHLIYQETQSESVSPSVVSNSL